MRLLLPLLFLSSSAHALQLSAISSPRVAAPRACTPWLSSRARLSRARAAPVAQATAEPAPTRMGSVVAGTYTGVMQFTFAAACASIIFAPVGLPLAIGIQHGLVGFVVTQAVVARTTSVRGGVALAVPSFEVLPFLARFAVIAAGAVGAGAGPGVLLATVLAGSIVANLLAAALLALASEAPVDNIDRLLPPPLQAGLFAAIGWSLYLLSFDVLGLGAGAGALLTLQSARLWVPANLFGLGLWRASRKGVGEGRASGGEAHPAAPISHLFRRPAPHPNLHPRRQRARARP